MEVIDFYEGFEGEPEIQIISKNSKGKAEAALRLWIGYLDAVVKLIEPNEAGFWEGVPLYYHTANNWEDVEIWECKDKELFVDQLNKIDTVSLSGDYEKAYQEILKILTESARNKDSVYFIYG